MPKSISASATLSDVVGVAVEYDLHLEPDRFIQYVDLYRVYIESYESITNPSFENHETFQTFITTQSLLDQAASLTQSETGEHLTPPNAFRTQEILESHHQDSITVS